MTYRSKILFHVVGLIIGMVFTSCIKEDRSNCPEEKYDVRVSFSFTVSELSSFNITDPTAFNRLNLFVFDHNNRFVGEWVDPSPVLTPEYYITVQLPPGRYRFVVWGSVNESFEMIPKEFISGTTHIDEPIMSLVRDNNNAIVHPPVALFYAHLNDVEIISSTNQRFVLPLVQNTNLIHVRTEGLNEPNDTYSIEILDNNGRYYFKDNSFAPDNHFSYTAPCYRDPALEIFGSLNVLRLSEGRPNPLLILRNDTRSTKIYQANLIELIVSLREQGVDIDIDNTHVYDIVLRFDDHSANVKIEVSINGWWLIEDNNQLKP